MPDHCCRPDYDEVFDARSARRQALAYRRDGPRGATRRLIEAIKTAGIEGGTALDIGGGVGVIGLELLAAGVASSTEIDASLPSIEVARHEAKRHGFADRATFRYGDFVELADEIEAADVVTLDRVICCYGDWPAMVDRATERSRRILGLVYPNARWWNRLGVGIANLMLRLSGRSFRVYIHPERAIDARIRAAGFVPRSHHRGWLWQTVVYERQASA